MPHPDVSEPELSLRAFLERCRTAGELDESDDPLAAEHAMARRLHERPDRLQLLGGVHPRVRVLGGLMATRERVGRALGVPSTRLVEHVAEALASTTPGIAPGAAPLFGAVTVPDPDLPAHLPCIRFYPGDGGPFFTAGIIAARHPVDGMNYSYHRMMVLGGNRLAVRVVPRHLHRILAEGGGRAEVAVLLGVHPAVALAAACSGPPDLDELALAGRLVGGRIPAAELDGLVIPASAEIVLRGRFDGTLAPEGPFVDITGTRDGVRSQPVLTVTRLHHRTSPILPVILPGGREHRLLMGLPQEPRILNAVRAAVPGVRAVALTPGGCCWLHAVVSIAVRHPGEGRNAGLAALAGHPSLKRVVVVDEDVDPTDAEQVEWAVATRCQPDRDVTVVPGVRGSSLDPSRDPATELTAKWIIDATVPPGRDRSEFVRVEPPPPAP